MVDGFATDATMRIWIIDPGSHVTLAQGRVFAWEIMTVKREPMELMILRPDGPAETTMTYRCRIYSLSTHRYDSHTYTPLYVV